MLAFIELALIVVWCAWLLLLGVRRGHGRGRWDMFTTVNALVWDLEYQTDDGQWAPFDPQRVMPIAQVSASPETFELIGAYLSEHVPVPIRGTVTLWSDEPPRVLRIGDAA